MLVEWLESGDWLIERNEDQHLFDRQMNGGGGNWPAVMTWLVGNGIVVLAWIRSRRKAATLACRLHKFIFDPGGKKAGVANGKSELSS